MPIYEYECTDKGHRFEMLQKMSDDPVQTCPECGGKVRKLISAAGFMLKGSGWYKDGYSSSKPASASASTESSSSASTSESTTKTTEAASPATTPNNKENKS